MKRMADQLGSNRNRTRTRRFAASDNHFEQPGDDGVLKAVGKSPAPLVQKPCVPQPKLCRESAHRHSQLYETSGFPNGVATVRDVFQRCVMGLLHQFIYVSRGRSGRTRAFTKSSTESKRLFGYGNQLLAMMMSVSGRRFDK